MARSLVVNIVGDASSLEKAFKKSSKSANTFGRSMEKTQSKGKRAFGGISRGAVGLAGAFLGPVGLAVAAKAAFGEMAESQKVSAQTAAVLKSTGKAAKVSAKQIDTLAESLMTMSGVDDEMIKQGENLLLTFTDIRNETGKGNDVFTQATRTMLDMSVALGRDTTQSAIQLGKALQDPVKGITALTRVGVNFTDAQKDQIKALVESGNTLKAQKLILRELNREFGGSAKAAGQTLPGKLKILQNTVLNLGGSLATLLTPAITKLVDRMVAWTSNSKNQKLVLDTVTAAASALESGARVLSGAFTALNAVTGSTKNTFKVLLGFFVAFKALKLAAYIAKMATAMRAYAIASAAATAAGAGGPGGVLAGGGKGGGKLGRWGKLSGSLGRIAGATVAIPVGIELGKGIRENVPGWEKFFRGVGAKTHDVRAGFGAPALFGAGRPAMAGGRPNINIEHFHSTAQNPQQMENELLKRHRQRGHQRRSTR